MVGWEEGPGRVQQPQCPQCLLFHCSSVHPQMPPKLSPPGPPTPGQSSEAELQWRLQVNRLQELIDQLECKVSSHVASAPWGRTFLESTQAKHTPGGLAHTLCPSQAPRLEPLHEEELTKGPDSVSLGEGQAAGSQGPGGAHDVGGFVGPAADSGSALHTHILPQAWLSPHPPGLARRCFVLAPLAL